MNRIFIFLAFLVVASAQSFGGESSLASLRSSMSTLDIALTYMERQERQNPGILKLTCLLDPSSCANAKIGIVAFCSQRDQFILLPDLLRAQAQDICVRADVIQAKMQ